MITTDLILIAALLVFLFAWWQRGLRGRTTILTVSALIALLGGTAGVLDYRWQAMAGVAVAGLALLVLLLNRLRGAKPRTGTPWLSGPLFTLLVAVAIAALWLFPIPDLPAPTGEHAVGVADFELNDVNRKGVFAAGEDEPRRLLVRVWYPAGDVSGIEPRPYFTDAEVTTTAAGLGGLMGAPFLFQYMKHSTTHSYPGAPLVAGADDLPVLVYSHGYTSFAGQNTVLMEHLASHGYIVYSVQHTYDASPTVFPNGEVVGMDPALLAQSDEPPEITDAMKNAFGGATQQDDRYEGQIQNRQDAIDKSDRSSTQSADVWLQDRIFVLDQLQQGRVPEALGKIVSASDFARTGQMGMSFGGSTTGAFCMVDARCAAGINLDGGDFHYQPFGVNMPVPFMMFYSDFSNMFEWPGGDENSVLRGDNDFSYERPETSGLRDDVYRLMVKNVKHVGVSDFTLFMRNPVRGMLVGSIAPAVMLPIQNDFVRGFFDKHLLGVDNDFPTEQYRRYAAWVEADETVDVRDWWLTKHPEDITEQVVLETDLGDIEIALYPVRAPLAVANFLAYVDGGLFDGAEFYRATRKGANSSFDIIQGGLMAEAMNLPMDAIEVPEPALPTIAHETTVQTGLLNQRGVLALARLAPGTAASEFFINISDSPMLDSGNTDDGRDGFGYTTFGRVLRGMRVVEKIQSLPTEQSSGNAVVNGQLLSNKVVIRRAYRAP